MSSIKHDVKSIIRKTLNDNNVTKYQCHWVNGDCVVVAHGLNRKQTRIITREFGKQGYKVKEVSFCLGDKRILGSRKKTHREVIRRETADSALVCKKCIAPKRNTSFSPVHISIRDRVTKIVVVPPQNPEPFPPLPNPDGTGHDKK